MSYNIKDLTGQRFGKLTAIKRERRNDRTYYLCKCECGGQKWVFGGNLTSGKTISCGCVRRQTEIASGYKVSKKHVINETNVKLIKGQLRNNNKSGVTGVYFDSGTSKWTAQITFQKKQYCLGRFINKEDAIQARKTAEQRMFGEFLEWYEKEYKNK